MLMPKISKCFTALIVSTYLLVMTIESVLASPIKLQNTPQELRAEVLNQVSVGSSIDDAQKMMETNGFKCNFVQNALIPAKPEYHSNALKCEKTKVDGLSGTIWNVFFIFTPTQAVADVEASIDRWSISW